MRIITIPGILIMLLFTANGCAFWRDHQQSVEKTKEQTQQKMAHYQALQEALRTKALLEGTPGSLIRQTYGEPDDVFHSMSMVSSFEIWTYEKADKDKSPNNWDSIRLYFNNQKLTAWKL
jgi:hypothetical protein